MTSSTVLGHIVSRRLSQEHENIATEALVYVLQRSESARRGFTQLLRAAHPELPNVLRFEAQDVCEVSRPDIAAFSPAGERRVSVEHKFWAGLTGAQPVDYLRELAKTGGPTLLAFVVPDARCLIVERELVSRLAKAGVSSDPISSPTLAHLSKTALGPYLAVTTWSCVLKALEEATSHDPEARADIQQIEGLCALADEGAFVPLASDELTDQSTPTRMLQFTAIVDSASTIAAREGFVSSEGLKAAGKAGSYGRYLWIGKVGIFLVFDCHLWKAEGRSPIWIRFLATKFGKAERVRPLLQQWSMSSGRLVTDSGPQVVVAIDLPTGEERDVVVRAIVDQLRSLAEPLAAVKEERYSDPAPSEDA